jgi:hypothetical protein
MLEEKTKQETNKTGENLSLATCVGFFIDLHFDSEDGGHMFLRNIGSFPNYKRDNPEDRNLHSHGSETRRSNTRTYVGNMNDSEY